MMITQFDGEIVYISENVHSHLKLFHVSLRKGPGGGAGEGGGEGGVGREGGAEEEVGEEQGKGYDVHTIGQ